MSIQALAAVRNLTRDLTFVEPRNRFVLYALADYADGNGIAWPSFNTLSEWTGYTRRSIMRSIAELDEEGFISVAVRTRGNGSFTSNVYRLLFVD